jgi:YVTN family beta-propeller protein
VVVVALSSTFSGLESAWADSVIKTIPVERPAGVAFNPSNNDMYVANHGGFTVSVIDSSTNEVVDTIPVGAFPLGIAFNPSNNDMYVTVVGSSTVSVIDSSTNTVVDTIPVERPHGVAFNPSNNDMYVANERSETVSVIDSSTNTVVDTIVVGSLPTGIAFNPTNNNIYVANLGSKSVSVIDSSTNEVVDTVDTVERDPIGIAFNPSNNDMYVANRDSNTVSVIATPTPTPQQAIQNLIDIIDSISKGITTSLESTLNAVIRQLNHNNDEAACNQLNAFLNKVDTRENNGRLTPQQAADLRQQATAIQDALGCSSSSPSSLLPPSSSLQSQRHQQQSPDTNLPSTLSIPP